ncbi:TetR/AcrR family transcriptional regulator [Amycolatopsis sp. FU40]|uniref:TetR/AcrR family transcriptional regulator n=1 Tax=Amycolatopsis sp. FU40 TaxID=2914159 RepID=UPI001F37501E|nr:TetR/AcrR family transcriptional regulator [Amycolatopsis sp. FU40]UKD58853.1 TetR/AcrR family transcriptional regulator [Amycolatopsis sp. FU40]
MSPRQRDTALRESLLATAAQVLAEEGGPALSTRRLARELGVSTTAVYTYFGSVEQLRREVRLEGFRRLEETMDPPVEDPVAALAGAAAAFFRFGMAEPHLYRAMFVDRPLDDDRAGEACFLLLRKIFARAVETGRFPGVSAEQTEMGAAQLWSTQHGLATMVLSGALPEAAGRAALADLVVRLAIGYGDDPAHAARSVSGAMK